MSPAPGVKSDQPAQYSAPAVDKALDVIELLASQPDGLALADIASQLERTMSEIYRVAIALVARGVIARETTTERYFLTGKLFELSHRFPPIERLLGVATPLMRALADRMEQSCHLAVLDREAVLIVASAESPLPMNYRVRVGARFPALETSSGVVLVAHQPRAQWDSWVQAVPTLPSGQLLQRLESALTRAAEELTSPIVQGVTNMSFAVRDHRGTAVAALTVPFLSQVGMHMGLADVRPMAQRTADELSAFLGFTPSDEQDRHA